MSEHTLTPHDEFLVSFWRGQEIEAPRESKTQDESVFPNENFSPMSSMETAQRELWDYIKEARQRGKTVKGKVIGLSKEQQEALEIGARADEDEANEKAIIKEAYRQYVTDKKRLIDKQIREAKTSGTLLLDSPAQPALDAVLEESIGETVSFKTCDQTNSSSASVNTVRANHKYVNKEKSSPAMQREMQNAGQTTDQSEEPYVINSKNYERKKWGTSNERIEAPQKPKHEIKYRDSLKSSGSENLEDILGRIVEERFAKLGNKSKGYTPNLHKTEDDSDLSDSSPAESVQIKKSPFSGTREEHEFSNFPAYAKCCNTSHHHKAHMASFHKSDEDSDRDHRQREKLTRFPRKLKNNSGSDSPGSSRSSSSSSSSLPSDSYSRNRRNRQGEAQMVLDLLQLIIQGEVETGGKLT